MILIDSTDTPHPITTIADIKSMDGYWSFDLQKRDFFNNQLTTVIELQSSSLTFEIEGNFIHLPVDWFIIVCDKMSGAIDTIQIHEMTNSNFKLFTVGPKLHTVVELGYRIVNFDQSRTFFYPAIAKHQLLCVAVSPTKWVFTTPNDTYQKYIKHISPADLLL